MPSFFLFFFFLWHLQVALSGCNIGLVYWYIVMRGPSGNPVGKPVRSVMVLKIIKQSYFKRQILCPPMFSSFFPSLYRWLNVDMETNAVTFWILSIYLHLNRQQILKSLGEEKGDSVWNQFVDEFDFFSSTVRLTATNGKQDDSKSSVSPANCYISIFRHS